MFEGSEKKLEIVGTSESGDFRALGDAFWREVVHAAQAEILSSAQTGDLTAYLLSESSLFVWRSRILMITCGTTRLIDAAELILERLFTNRSPEFLIYERKNEVAPHRQATAFEDDARRLAARVDGTAYRFGPEDEHHLYLFSLNAPCQTPDAMVTAELLMCGLSAQAREAFSAPTWVDIQQLLPGLFDGFIVDEFRFEPQGYSLNALRDDAYITIHVTPEVQGSYASFETNAWFGEALDGVMQMVREAFAPRACDLIVWDRDEPWELPDIGLPKRRVVRHHLSNGYRLTFGSFAESERSEWSPAVLPIRP